MSYSGDRVVSVSIEGLPPTRPVSPVLMGEPRPATLAVMKLLEGTEVDLSPWIPPCESLGASAFAQDVYRAMGQIGYGKVMTYGELAAAAGHPGASRATGTACGRNRVALILPCHRVVAANGMLGGFGSCPAWKRYLLRLEGVERR